MKEYINKWTYMRLIQCVVGLYFIWNFIEDDSKLSLAFGILMLFQAVFNIGCFSSKGCSTTVNHSDQAEPFVKKIKRIN